MTGPLFLYRSEIQATKTNPTINKQKRRGGGHCGDKPCRTINKLLVKAGSLQAMSHGYFTYYIIHVWLLLTIE